MTTTPLVTLPTFDDYVIEIEPLHLMVTKTHEGTGVSIDTHVQRNHDLGIDKEAGQIIRSAQDGVVLVAVSVDGEHDEVHFQPPGGADAEEMLMRGIESLTLALEVVRGAQRKG